tara:strand:- start:2304 stop:2990 length:687 start_codon:yes stop_codon:yes gene_type:complete
MKIKDLQVMIKETMDENSILLAKPTLLTEANFKRVKRRIEDEGIPFVMITGFRGDYNRKQNDERNAEIKMSLDDAGLPYTQMPGSGYKEGGEEGDVVVEDSILVWDDLRGDKFRASENLFDIAKGLAREFEQDSFIFGGPHPGKEDGDYGIHLYTSEGNVIDEIWAGGPEGYTDLVVVDDAAEYWSKIAGKKTQFTEIYNKWKNYKAKSRLDAMKKQYYLRLAESKIG